MTPCQQVPSSRKQLIIVLFLLAITLPATSFATSGACSYHGGVNCDAGPGPLGQSVCNDGSVDSSVLYYSNNECLGNPAASCVYPVPQCTEGQYESLKAQLGAYEEQGASLGIEQTAPSEYGGMVALFQKQLNDCQSEISSYPSMVQTYNSCMQQVSSAAASKLQAEKSAEQQNFAAQYAAECASISVLNGETSIVNSKCITTCDSGYQLVGSSTCEAIPSVASTSTLATPPPTPAPILPTEINRQKTPRVTVPTAASFVTPSIATSRSTSTSTASTSGTMATSSSNISSHFGWLTTLLHKFNPFSWF